jgi:hypothetical protein
MRRKATDTRSQQTVIKRRTDAGASAPPDDNDPGLISPEIYWKASPRDPIPAPAGSGQTEHGLPTQFYGVVELIPTHVGRDAGEVADKVIAHLAGLTGAVVTITLEIAANIPDGVPEDVYKQVIRNSYKLKFREKRFE